MAAAVKLFTGPRIQVAVYWTPNHGCWDARTRFVCLPGAVRAGEADPSRPDGVTIFLGFFGACRADPGRWYAIVFSLGLVGGGDTRSVPSEAIPDLHPQFREAYFILVRKPQS
jgi:hypothetical protein